MANLNKTIAEIFNDRYIVPLYQRNFAWEEIEITQLLQDIYESFKKDKESNYFIGTLVVLKRKDGIFEIIDGQQRLTVLSLMIKILNINNTLQLSYDSRKEVEGFLQLFYANPNSVKSENNPEIIDFQNAIDYIKEAKLDAKDCDNSPYIGDEKWDEKDKFKEFIEKNVILIRVEVPVDTDVASYFEIMNNRGEQLQKHEILKAQMIEKITKENENRAHQEQFAQIWDACSQMDIPIQTLFDNDKRKEYFEEDYNGFNFKKAEESTESTESKSISEILKDNTDMQTINDDKSNDESTYKTIIDFPNFLMHIFKLEYNKEIPLNDNELINTYDTRNSIDSMEFIEKLFFYRVVFDRFIIKTIDDEESEDKIKWVLEKPEKNDKQNVIYKNSFDDNKKQERVIKALSMLQVSFRSRIYKNWLQDVLRYFQNRKNIEVSADEYIKFLDEKILSYYKEKFNITKENQYSLGTKTPHFLFNFIDYLYYIKSRNNDNKIDDIKIEDFDFKYWNSVEHHLAQNKNKQRTDKIDSLGNLYLISKSVNSRLSDRIPKEKAEFYKDKNMGVNRQIIYKITENNNEWGEKEIIEHYENLATLLNEAETLLKSPHKI
ncbi:hypothetical protein CCY99_00850 [Helicobacter sp. 16-1353]|uniref:DUF262 domain-containing protein n=1 Tax=Helicobacter sp. 16-1353 TaxID=2004996 RepID=UPI000DCDD6DE|nr:DUF262 domain-containing protein [Helicobacter sp. 16-1353]RAX55280.1 hypothetical protein CCY99_00850 [Helicobacter sp. 16-1353]